MFFGYRQVVSQWAFSNSLSAVVIHTKDHISLSMIVAFNK
ncbi:hypothetical protein CZ787_17670 [Halomonas citrativorans]|uniref:Uncharacterized protein n=1 Tax=Halomonas citrativorans TaxID=2742612 RepID=A0A1R4I554_9GAMM|nr:hypothetical protein CZ787_17670 [Halomonas citrativorans]